MSKCKICDRPIRALGYCESHYKRFKKYGDPLAGRLSPMFGSTLEARFWAKVDKRGPNECWPWTASLNGKGYGMLANGKRGSTPAHRVSYAINVGELDDNKTVDHSCHTTACAGGNDCRHRRCVNPAHLRLLTNLENIAVGTSFSAVNSRKTHCVRGHALTDENSYGYKGRRQCKTCARDRANQQSADPAQKARKRQRYRVARAAGLTPDEARLERSRAN